MRGLLEEVLRERGFAVATAGSAADAARLLTEFDPDAALIDIDLGSGPNGIDVAHVIADRFPHVAVVFLTRKADARAAGLTKDSLPLNYAFLRKDLITGLTELDTALEAALRDLPSLPRHDQAGSNLRGLTNDQWDVLRMVAEGWTNAAIAETRGTSERSVERLLRGVFQTLGLTESSEVNRRVEAVRIFVAHAGVPSRRPGTP